MKLRPIVSVVVITYNHAEYITKCLDSILSQQDVQMEVIVADDASSDDTQSVIKQYAKNDTRIVPILRRSNVGITKNLIGAMDSAKGKYIALCEGDDFWIDDKKLAKQQRRMEKKPTSTVCFHPVSVVKSNGTEKVGVFPDRKSDFTLQALIKSNFIQTNSVMYKNIGPYKGIFYDDVLPLDWLIHVYHAKKGNDIIYIDSEMSSYRKHEGGVWWRDDKNIRDFWKKNGEKHFRMFENMTDIVADDTELTKLVHQSSSRLVETMIVELNSVNDVGIAKSLLKRHPEIVLDRLVDVCLQIENAREEARALSDELAYKIAESEDLREQRDRLSGLLKEHQESLSWRVTSPLRSLKGKLHR